MMRRTIAICTSVALLPAIGPWKLDAAEDFSRTQKILITGLVFGVAGGVTALINAKKGGAKAPKADIAISPGNVDFGSVAATDPVMNLVTVSNTSAQTLRISELRVEPAQFETVDTPALPLEIKPGSDWRLRVRYRPQAGKKARGSLEFRCLLADTGKTWRARVPLRGIAQ